MQHVNIEDYNLVVQNFNLVVEILQSVSTICNKLSQNLPSGLQQNTTENQIFCNKLKTITKFIDLQSLPTS